MIINFVKKRANFNSSLKYVSHNEKLKLLSIAYRSVFVDSSKPQTSSRQWDQVWQRPVTGRVMKMDVSLHFNVAMRFGGRANTSHAVNTNIPLYCHNTDNTKLVCIQSITHLRVYTTGSQM